MSNKTNVENLKSWLQEDLPYREKHNLKCALAIIEELEQAYDDLLEEYIKERDLTVQLTKTHREIEFYKKENQELKAKCAKEFKEHTDIEDKLHDVCEKSQAKAKAFEDIKELLLSAGYEWLYQGDYFEIKGWATTNMEKALEAEEQC